MNTALMLMFDVDRRPCLVRLQKRAERFDFHDEKVVT